MSKKIFFLFFVLTSIANSIPILFNKYIMFNMSTAEYIKYQALWTIVLWFQPAVSLGSQNIIRVKNDFQNISGYVTNTIFISILLIFFGILIGVDFFSLLCGFLITMVSYTICYFESSKKLLKSSLLKFFWLFSSGIITVLFVSYFNYYSRIYSSLIISSIIIIYFFKTLFKKNKFNLKLFDNYGLGLSALVVVVNLVFFFDRNELYSLNSDHIQYQFACGFFLMNLVLFGSRPLILLSEIGIVSKNIWNIKKTYISFLLCLIFLVIAFFFRDFLINLFFFNEDNLTVEKSTVLVWLLIGAFRFFSDLLIPLISSHKYFLYLASLFLILGYLLVSHYNFNYIPYFYMVYFCSLALFILNDYYSKYRSIKE